MTLHKLARLWEAQTGAMRAAILLPFMREFVTLHRGLSEASHMSHVYNFERKAGI